MDHTQQDPQGTATPTGATPTGPDGAGEMDAVVSGIVRTGPWVRFMAVISFVGVGLMALVGLIIMLAGGSIGSELGSGIGFAVGLFYLAMAAVYLIPLIPLHRFASEASRLKADPSPAVIARAVEQSRSFWVRVGVLAIIGLALVPALVVLSIFMAFANR